MSRSHPEIWLHHSMWPSTRMVSSCVCTNQDPFTLHRGHDMWTALSTWCMSLHTCVCVYACICLHYSQQMTAILCSHRHAKTCFIVTKFPSHRRRIIYLKILLTLFSCNIPSFTKCNVRINLPWLGRGNAFPISVHISFSIIFISMGRLKIWFTVTHRYTIWRWVIRNKGTL